MKGIIEGLKTADQLRIYSGKQLKDILIRNFSKEELEKIMQDDELIVIDYNKVGDFARRALENTIFRLSSYSDKVLILINIFGYFRLDDASCKSSKLFSESGRIKGFPSLSKVLDKLNGRIDQYGHGLKNRYLHRTSPKIDFKANKSNGKIEISNHIYDREIEYLWNLKPAYSLEEIMDGFSRCVKDIKEINSLLANYYTNTFDPNNCTEEPFDLQYFKSKIK